MGHGLVTEINMSDLVDFTIYPRTTAQTAAEMTATKDRVQNGTALIQDLMNEARTTVGWPGRLL